LIPFLLKQSLFHFFLAFFYKVKKDNWFLKRNENGTPFLFAFAFSVLFGLKSFSKNEFFEKKTKKQTEMEQIIKNTK